MAVVYDYYILWSLWLRYVHCITLYALYKPEKRPSDYFYSSVLKKSGDIWLEDLMIKQL